jgi:CheY-like chemotaxis protein
MANIMKALSGKKILLLDDEVDLCELLQEEFEMAGATVFVCYKLEDAKKSISENSFDVVLSDINLPDGDGLSLLAFFRDQGKSANIYFFSGKAAVSSQQAMQAGALGVFQKPCKIESIIDAIALSFLPLADRIRKGRLSLSVENLPVDVQLEGLDGISQAKVVNIGNKGMFVSADSPLPYVGQPISFRIHLPSPEREKETIAGRGFCRWVRGQPVQESPRGFGLEFEVSAEFQNMLDSFLEEQRGKRESPPRED